ncbi:MAG: hypothetical protein ABR616_18795 [Dermatophilaceae bacterium]|nr:hypothetical protein [Intrasporangiaceae bacterium]
MEHKTEGKYRADVGGNGEGSWATNALRFDTVEDATDYAKDLLGRWMGANIARVVVDDETPDREAIDMADERIVVNWRA